MLKVTADRQRLAKLAYRIQLACHKPGGTKPILETLKLSAADNLLTVAGTDELAYAEGYLTAKVRKAGETCVNALLFAKAIKGMQSDEVELDLQDRTLHVDGDVQLKLATMEASIFPVLPMPKDLPTCKVNVGVILDLFNIVSPAVDDREDARLGSLNGILWKIDGGVLELQATDTSCFSAAKGPAPFQSDGLTEKTVVPADAFRLILRLTEDDRKQDVDVGVDQGSIHFRTDSGRVAKRLLLSRFPDGRAGIQKSHKTAAAVRLPVEQFRAALRKVAVVGDRVRLTADGQELTLRTADRQNEAETVIQVKEYKKDDKPMPGIEGKGTGLYDTRVLLAALHSLPEDATLSVRIGGPTVMVMQALGGNFLCGVSPMTKEFADEVVKKPIKEKKDRTGG